MADDKPLRPLEKWVPASDVLSKIVIAAALGLIGAYLTMTKNQNDFALQCTTMINNLLKVESGKVINVDVISYQIQQIPSNCDVNRNELLKQVSSLIGKEASPPATVATSTPADPTTLSGWVAIGVPGTGAYKDMNFDFADGLSITSRPADGSVVRARWQVYVRPGPADWSKTLGILRTGECFQVTGSRALKAGDRDQIWASGQRRECPQSATSL